MIWSWFRRRPFLADLGLVALLVALTIAAATRHQHTTAGVVLGVVETPPLLWRRSRLPFQLAVALYTLAAARGDLPVRLAGLGSIGATAIALPLARDFAFGDEAARVVFLGAAFLLGDGLRSRRAYVREIEEKAERLERERQTEARRAAAEEQARIARELHDVVAHALSVIVVQAGAADDVFEVEPRLAREPIRAIDAAARAALADLRRVLGVIQHDADYAPQPGLAGLDTLVEQVRATGLDVALQVEGRARPLPATVDLSAYRIVQEALTNTLKHAHAERVNVHVRYGDTLLLEVQDNGRGAVNGGSGSGLIGMRERVALLGGTLETGPGPGGGYRVAASIPAGTE